MKNQLISPEKPWPVYLLSGAALLILAFFSVGYYHPDEHFQILEFARWKLDPSRPEPLPWEFHYQMRAAIQPAIVVATHRFFALFGCSDPFLITFFLRILSAGLVFLSMRMIYRRYLPTIRDEKLRKWFLGLSFLLWFALYNAVRFSSETWSGAIFILGFSWLLLTDRAPRNSDYLLSGLFLGFSFVFRYSTGFLIFGYLLWFFFFRLVPGRDAEAIPGALPVKKIKIRQLVVMILGLAGAIVSGILIDRWFYGEWVVTAWNYFGQNILAGKMSGFGVQPWWFYFEEVFIRAIPPFSLVFILSCLLFFIYRRNDLLTWTLVPFLLIHFLLGHKETRFFYPLIGFLPVIVIRGIEIIQSNWRERFTEGTLFRIFAKSFWIVNCGFIFLVFFIPADNQIGIYRLIYHHYPEPITLYYTSDDPYQRALAISYYKRKNLTIKKADTGAGMDSIPRQTCLVAVRNNDPVPNNGARLRLIYSSYPDCFRYVNFNHWLDRTQQWRIYEAEK